MRGVRLFSGYRSLHAMGEPLAAFTFLTAIYSEEAPGVLPLFLLPSRRTLWQRLHNPSALTRSEAVCGQ